ncbi:MAG: tetratricopeptide repeat protein [Bryobacteraceae bacterium]|nr:tetratricopeptide repeat protein [Bryobacteraceae bacterium]
MSAEVFEKRRNRRNLLIAGAAFAGVAIAWFSYDLYTAPAEARKSMDAGLRKMAVGGYVEATKEFDRTIRRQPGLTEAYFLRGKAYAGLLDWGKAMADLTIAVSREPDNAKYRIARGEVYLQNRDLPRAIEDYTRAVEIHPGSATGFTQRGIAWRLSGNVERSLEDLTRAIKIEPSSDCYYERGATYQAAGNHAKAIEDFNLSIEFRPTQPHLYYARALSRRAIGDLAGARADHQKGRELDRR